MSRARAGWILWGAALLLVPLPYFIVAEGAVPVVRIGLLAGVAGAYAALVDGSGVAWPMTIILALHVVTYSAALALASVLVVRTVPARVLRWLVPGLVAVALLIATVFEVYRTPFDDARPRATWPELFQ